MAILNEKKVELEKKRQEMETKYNAEKVKLQGELTKKEAALRQEAAAKGEAYRGQGLEALAQQQAAMRKEHRRLEHGLDAAEDDLEQKDLVVDPGDDPLLLHAEVRRTLLHCTDVSTARHLQ